MVMYGTENGQRHLDVHFKNKKNILLKQLQKYIYLFSKLSE